MARRCTVLSVPLLVVTALALAPLDAGAQLITIEFAGTVTLAEMNAGLFGPSVQLGDPFTGHFRYDLAATDQLPADATKGRYDAIDWIIDGSTVTLTNPTIRIELDTMADGLIVSASGGTYANGISLLIAAAPGTFGFDWLPASLDLADFSTGIVIGSKGYISVDPGNPSTLVRDSGTLTSLLPEPGGLGPAAAAALAVAARLRQRSPKRRVRSAGSRAGGAIGS